ncbi:MULTISPECIES: aminotransferase class I/II-fold pyridoxal phosphate-dependent enzyme [Synechococcaceae]|uniref:aminotransferase class I/II-fold pyridoxal phosphate-dependent enzyme n=1 Tax=Synechococcaceae TaxID=1890426 RepID=UPI001F37AC87|nr:MULTISPECIES: aminotransferase class I/II-fold pyridoxal phosphate-dependent enzyme [Synechococcaceae]MCT4363441.1 aminotransferase class I/II-fold pyridoxal phosphate-dependent enzyme [Candidatus Regnicoccus frigidus MAG-AL1]MCT4367936.1 aminotransferase class I/II-fold pyridoxal phosphate-dependent enzyme [Candidatus Regnicoccus frigidus MAG-AL2]
MVVDPLSPLSEALERLPADQRRQLRSFSPAGAGLLQADQPQAPLLLDLASNDYLGLSAHPRLRAAAHAAIDAQGIGAGASRLISGSRPVHAALEERLAAWLGRERVLLFPSGFQANLAAVIALADRHSLVLADRLIHHSLLVGVRASGARLRRFAHNDSAALEALLQQQRREDPQRRLLVLTESLFSMEGTSPELAVIAGLCQNYGALLLVDEAHALGVLGSGGRGLAHGLAGVSLISGTFGKAFGSGGAFLAGDGPIGEWLLQTSGAFRYSTALAPPLAAAALAALELLEEEPSMGRQLQARARHWRRALEQAGWGRPAGEGPILPLPVGPAHGALALQQQLERGGLLSVAIRPPTVPTGSSRLRLVLRRDLPSGSLERLLLALGAPPQRGAP